MIIAQPPAPTSTSSELSTEVAKAVMVTAELGGVKTIPAALAQIERSVIRIYV